MPNIKLKWKPEDPIRDFATKGYLVLALRFALKMAKVLGDEQMTSKTQDLLDRCMLVLDSNVVDGQSDPSCEEVFRQLRFDTCELADALRVAWARNDKDAPARYKKMGDCDADIRDISSLVADFKANALMGDDSLDAINSLCLVLQSQRIEEHEAKLIFSDIISDANLPVATRAYVVGAVCHNLISRHNRHVVRALVSAIRHDPIEPMLTGREAAAVVADFLSWPNLWDIDEGLTSDLKELMDERADVAAVIRTTLIYFAKTRMVPEIERFVRVELAQEINKIVKKILDSDVPRKSERIVITEDDVQGFFGVDSGTIKDKFIRFEKWRVRGVDVEFTSLKNMKTAPFFRDSINWLRPFVVKSPFMDSLSFGLSTETKAKLLDAVDANYVMADSDKYSLALNFESVDEKTATELAKSFTIQKEVLDEANESAPVSADALRSMNSADRFIKDLYRGFHLRAGEFGPTAIFDDLTPALASNAFDSFFADDKDLSVLGTALVEFNCWPEAVSLYRKIIALKESEGLVSAQDIRKLALCLLKCDKIDEALEQLKKADIIDDTDPWTKIKMAQCHIEKKRYSSAAYILGQVRELGRSDRKVLSLLAMCKTKMKMDDEALAVWQELIYADENDIEAKAEAGICLFRLCRDAEAEQMSGQLPETTDASPVALVVLRALIEAGKGNLLSAKNLMCKLRDRVDMNTINSIVDENSGALVAHGVSFEHQMLMLDAVHIFDIDTPTLTLPGLV